MRFARSVTIFAGILFAIFGLYAFIDPRGFFDGLAKFEPYNRHFIHDIGAFQIGIGAMLLLAVYARDAILAVLTGVSVGQLFHLLSHIQDRDLGDKQEQAIPFLLVLTILLVAAAIMRARGGSTPPE